MTIKIGLLTAGSDSPGLNAAIRGFGKAAASVLGAQVIGFRDGFEGLVNNQTVDLSGSALSGLLTVGGTILGTSRVIPASFPTDGKTIDRTADALAVYHSLGLNALVCIGGKETVAACHTLDLLGIKTIVIPKAADNDMPGTERAIGFDTAVETATQAIDRLHSTANATHRIMIVELLGLTSGWLTLGAGMAAGADVILIPEIPYDTGVISSAILARNRSGKNFSIIAIAEGARSKDLVAFIERSRKMNEKLREGGARAEVENQLEKLKKQYSGQTLLLASQLEEATRLISRITILGALVRGGLPSASDRILATQMAEYAVRLVSEGKFGTMVSSSEQAMNAIPLSELVGKTKPIPLDHAWLTSARQVGTCLGD